MILSGMNCLFKLKEMNRSQRAVHLFLRSVLFSCHSSKEIGSRHSGCVYTAGSPGIFDPVPCHPVITDRFTICDCVLTVQLSMLEAEHDFVC